MNAIFELFSDDMVSKSLNLAEFMKWLLYGQEQFLLNTQAKDNSKRGILYYLAYPPGWSNRSSQTLTTEESKSIRYLLREGVRSDELDVHEISVLHQACRDNRLDLVELLVSRDFDMNAMDFKGYTPLHYAIESRNFELVDLLIQRGSNANGVSHREQWGHPVWAGTPLYIAAKLNWTEAVAVLN